MINEHEIQQALHASRVVSLDVSNPHGPLGLEHLAERVAQMLAHDHQALLEPCVRRPVALSLAAWERLDHLAQDASQESARPVSASQLASAILEAAVKMNK